MVSDTKVAIAIPCIMAKMGMKGYNLMQNQSICKIIALSAFLLL